MDTRTQSVDSATGKIATTPSLQIVEGDYLAYLRLRLRSLVTESNWIRRALGQNPKRCPNCGNELD
jgi:hypothetical protein